MHDDFLSDEDFQEKLRDIGESPEFRYETDILPIESLDIDRMLRQACESFDSTSLKVRSFIGNDEGMRAFDRLSRRVKAAPYAGRLRDILRLESEILDLSKKIIDSRDNDGSVYVAASALMVVEKVNGQLDSFIDGKVGRSETVDLNAVDDCDRELRVQKEKVGVALATA